MFTDLRGFTGLTERFANDPAGLLSVLNADLRRVVRSIAICGGVVEKFVGDGVMATFGAGVQSDHVDRAMAAAIGLVGASESLNRRHAGEWGFRLDVGVGIASGPVVIGAVGSPERSRAWRARRFGQRRGKARDARGAGSGVDDRAGLPGGISHAAERTDEPVGSPRARRYPRDLPNVAAWRPRRPGLSRQTEQGDHSCVWFGAQSQRRARVLGQWRFGQRFVFRHKAGPSMQRVLRLLMAFMVGRAGIEPAQLSRRFYRPLGSPMPSRPTRGRRNGRRLTAMVPALADRPT